MNNIVKIWIVVILLPYTLLSQTKFSDNLSLRTDFHYGFVIPEYKHFIYLVNKPITSLDISLLKKTTGNTDWEQLYKYPEYGITLSFSTLGNKDVFGNEIAIFPFIQSFIIRKEKFQITSLFGLGLGYATKKFDLETNYENISVGSHFNIHFNYKLGARFKLSNKFSLNTGLSFSHYSNANMAEPNLGVNLFTSFAGINYVVGQQKEFTKNEISAHVQKHEFAFIYAAGGKHTRALQSTVFFTSSLSGEFKYHWKRKIHFGLGADIFYDSSTKHEMNSPVNKEYRSIYDYRTGIHFSQELVYDKFSFILQEGIYLGLTDQVGKNVMYNRAILRWKFNDHFLMNISMKSHLHILDYPELGFGYFFTRSK